MALNKVIIMGRITQELEIKQTTNGVSVLQFTVALDRYSKNAEEKQADFISCVAWRNTAEFIYKYFGKGRMIAITGNLHSRTYEDKNGTKHYVTEVYVDSADFTGESKDAQRAAQPPQNANGVPGMNAVPKANNSIAPDMMSGEFEGFEVFSNDGVPF